jgi:hypothetical protein
MAFLPFEVEDAAGNVTRGKIALASPPGTPQGTREGRPALPLLPRWASLHLGTVVADLAAAPAAPLRTAAQPEREPPVIRLEELATQPPIYDDKLYLEGEVTAASAIVAFSIDGASQLAGKLPRQRESRRLFFGQMVPLQVGENRLRLEATDALGGMTQRDLVVLRKVQEVRQLEARWRIAVLPLEKSGEPAGLGETVYDHLLAAFVQQARFRLLERTRLEDILREQRFSQTAHVDRVTAIKTGKIAAVEGILFGTVSQHKPQTLEVIVHFADVETTEHLASVDIYGEELELRDVKFLMYGLAWKFQQRFPLVEGVVIERDGERLTVNRGSQDALKQFMKTILFRDSGAITDPETGKPLGKRIENLGEARIIEVSDAFAQAALLRSTQTRDVKKLDKFITK